MACTSASRARWVMKISAGLVAEPLLLHGSDRHVVIAEHAGHLGQHTGPVGTSRLQVVRGLHVVDGPDDGLGELCRRRRASPCGRLTAASMRSPRMALASVSPRRRVRRT